MNFCVLAAILTHKW